MTGLFNPPVVHINASLNNEQRARGAAVLVAAQARPGSSLSELLHLAEYVVPRDHARPDEHRLIRLPEVFAADPSVFAGYRTRTGEEHAATFPDGAFDRVENDEVEDDGLG